MTLQQDTDRSNMTRQRDTDRRAAADPGPTEWEGVTPPAGVGPMPWPWPDDPRLDPDLLAGGDRRNVIDGYRYWRHEAIVADLDSRRHPFHVAIENFAHDMNIGTVVRTANAFLAREVHIVGHRRWNKRGAMVTDRYQHLRHHDGTAALLRFAHDAALPVVDVSSTASTRRPETDGPSTRLPVPWSFAALRTTNASSGRPGACSMAMATGSAPSVSPPTASNCQSAVSCCSSRPISGPASWCSVGTRAST
jgi:hypothetical protein